VAAFINSNSTFAVEAEKISAQQHHEIALLFGYAG